jgi:hypothetical protein
MAGNYEIMGGTSGSKRFTQRGTKKLGTVAYKNKMQGINIYDTDMVRVPPTITLI